MKFRKLFLLYFCYCSSSQTIAIQLQKSYTLKIPTTLPIGGDIAPLGDLCLKPLNYMLEIVNNRTDILPEYNLVIDVLDNQCLGSVGLKKILPIFFGERVERGPLVETPHLNSSEKKHIIYKLPRDRTAIFPSATSKFYIPPIVAGGLCSAVCSVVSRTVQFFDFINVSPKFLHI